MNIALSAVIIFILLLPPIVFYLSYSFGRFPKTGPKFTLLDGVLICATISLIVHSVAIVALRSEIHFDVFLLLMGGEIKEVEQTVPNGLFASYMKQFAIYNIILLSSALVAGRVARFLVIKTGYNRPQKELFRLHNHWWYFFNGKNINIEEFDAVHVDAMVETKEGPVIYTGILIDFICDGEKLDRIYLGDVLRRRLRFDEAGMPVPAEAVPNNIDGEIFSLSYDKIINLNLRFIVVEDPIDEITQLQDAEEEETVETMEELS